MITGIGSRDQCRRDAGLFGCPTEAPRTAAELFGLSTDELGASVNSTFGLLVFWVLHQLSTAELSDANNAHGPTLPRTLQAGSQAA